MVLKVNRFLESLSWQGSPLTAANLEVFRLEPLPGAGTGGGEGSQGNESSKYDVHGADADQVPEHRQKDEPTEDPGKAPEDESTQKLGEGAGAQKKERIAYL